MPKVRQTNLFVYGTLRKSAKHTLHRLLLERADFLGTGSIQGKLYDLGRYPGAVCSSRSSDRVTGEIYRLRGGEKSFELLDRYEGKQFKRRRVSVLLRTGARLGAWAYLYCGAVREPRRITSGDYSVFLAHD